MVVAGLIVSCSLIATRAHADDVVITAADGTPWTQLVDEIQNDPATAGRTYSIEVRSRGLPVRCADYTLALDDTSARAFRIDGCDPITQATALRVVDRAALFEPGQVVPRARRATMHATVVARGAVEGGGAAPRASSDLWCSVELMPTLWDALHGVRVPLTPDRFDVITLDGGVAVASQGAGWEARGESHAALQFRYEAIERATGTVVLTSTATLECADSPTVAGAPDSRDSPDSIADATPWTDGAPVVPAIPALPAIPKWPAARATYTGAGIVWDLVFGATRLTRSTTTIQNDSGMPIASTAGAHDLTYWGATVGYDFRVNWLTFLMNYTFGEGDGGMAGVWTLGLGATYAHGPVAFYAVPAVRISLLGVDGVVGLYSDFDASLVVGTHVHLGEGRWQLTAQASAPLHSSSEWAVTFGIGRRMGM